MTATREAITLPAVFLTVVLLGSVEPGAVLHFAPPPLFTLLLGLMLIAAIVQSGALAPDRLVAAERTALANLNGLAVLFTFFAASTVAIAVVLPASGIPAVLMGILWLALLAQALAIGADRQRLLRGLMVSFAIAFTLKFVVLAALSAPATGPMGRIVQLLFEGVTLGSISQPQLAPASGYLAFATLLLYLFGLVLLPRREEPTWLATTSPADLSSDALQRR